MRQITNREKMIMGAGVLIALAILVYFVFLPMFQGDQSDSTSSLEEMRERVESFKKLETMEANLVELEKHVKKQAGYENISFKRRTAYAAINNFIAQTAAQSEIGELDQLDAKANTSRKSQTNSLSDQTIIRSVVDQMYLGQVLSEISGEADESEDQDNADTAENPADDDSESGEEIAKVDDSDDDEVGEPDSSDKSEEPQESESPETATDMEANAEADKKPVAQPVFPVIPKDIPDEVRKSLVKLLEASQGKTISLANINLVMDEAGLEDERDRVRKRLKLYSDRVNEKKNEISRWVNKLQIPSSIKDGDKMGEFAVKMVFKGRIEQLVKFLYNIQESAKWIKFESMRISIADRKETVLNVELSMTATALYDL